MYSSKQNRFVRPNEQHYESKAYRVHDRNRRHIVCAILKGSSVGAVYRFDIISFLAPPPRSLLFCLFGRMSFAVALSPSTMRCCSRLLAASVAFALLVAVTAGNSAVLRMTCLGRCRSCAHSHFRCCCHHLQILLFMSPATMVTRHRIVLARASPASTISMAMGVCLLSVLSVLSTRCACCERTKFC